MARPGVAIAWAPHPNTIRVRLGALGPETHRRLERRFQARAFQAEAAMKVEAPWTNRTGSARAGLHATAEVGATSAELVLAHTVDYGVWLELANAGRYAIVIPTTQRMVGEVQRDLAGLW